MFADQRAFVRALEGAGELRRITAQVDPYLEITEIADRVVKQGGPALLFENVKGSPYPLLINPLGTARRVEIALGRTPTEIGAMLLGLAESAMPPSPRRLWQARGGLRQLLSMRTRKVRRAPCQEVVEAPALTTLPVQTCWPGDGGPFITFGLVITRDPVTRERNMGLYRIQVYDDVCAGMHWQIVRGGGNHYARAEELGVPLEVAVVIGADPSLLLSAISALPEGMDEIAFSGLLRRGPCPMVRCKSIDLEVPANAEIVLEGVVMPGERRLEGPFGDHFGHYSHAAPFPVLRVSTVTRRRDPVYLSAIVGLPPQEDKYIGNATQEILGPLIKLLHPEIDQVWAYFEAGFHNLLVVSVRQRFYKESLKTALALMGTGQLSLTKCMVLVDEDIDAREFDAVLQAVRENFQPDHDFMLLPGVPLDTLDFTSYRMNLGSKIIIDATSGRDERLHGAPGADREAVASQLESAAAEPGVDAALEAAQGYVAGVATPTASRAGSVPDPRGLDSRIVDFALLQDCLLVVQVSSQGREVIERLVQEDLGTVRLLAAVSADVDLRDRDLLLWGVFTRFDCARDVVFTQTRSRGPWTTCYGVLGIDATAKPGYPERLEMPADLTQQVDRRWTSFGLD